VKSVPNNFQIKIPRSSGGVVFPRKKYATINSRTVAQKASHFHNPRGVNIERVRFCLLFTIITPFFVTNMSFCHYLTKGHGQDAD
jgi:hypothetical protein